MKKSIVFFFSFLLVLGIVNLAHGQTNVVPDDQEFQALKALYDSLGGSTWTTKTNWPAAGSWPATATAAQMGTWYGITVANGDITAVALTANNLIGKIPAAVSNLKALITLNLYTNQLRGSIPSSIGSLTKLTTLQLYGNQLTGQIPRTIGNLTSLMYLHLWTNQLSGALPTELSNCTGLRTIRVDGNKLTSLEPLGVFPGLNTFYAGTNQITGTIPDWLGNQPVLQTLVLNANKFTGSIPASLGKLTNLISLWLQTNQLSGSIPATLGNLTKLQTLWLSSNQLTGPIPSTLGNLAALTNLSLDGNQLSGSIPASLGSLSNVVTFTLANNKLTGSIPSELGTLTKVRYLYLNNNTLSGSLPATMSNMVGLGYFKCDYNYLTGPLPDFSRLTTLSQLTVTNNTLSGEIFLAKFSTAMVDFQLMNNQFSGTLPDLSSWTSLTIIKIGSNRFTGAFPNVANNHSLNYIYAANNGFTTAPSSIINLTNGGMVSFTNNALDSITNLRRDYKASALHPSTTLNLSVDGNQLDFSALEILSSISVPTLKVSPQNTIADVAKVTYVTNSTLTVPGRPKGQYTTATWQKQNTDGTWADVTAGNTDATQQTFQHTAAPLADEGVYKWSMTSTKVTGLTLQSAPITVTTTARTALNQWAFQYQYDGRRRMIAKRVPGADWVYMVYDSRDRLVLTQDGNQRANNQWAFTKYDQLNRPILTGIRDTVAGVTRQQMQAAVDAFYANKVAAQFGETFVGYTGTDVHGYSNNTYPKRTGTTTTEVDPTKYLTVTYYDNYAFLANDDATTYQYVPNDAAAQTVGSVTYQQPATSNASVIGQVTGTKVKAMDNYIYWLKSVNYYDDKYRVVQSIADHQRMGQQRTTNVYDFVGKVLTMKSTTITQGPAWQNKTNVVVTGNQVTLYNQPCCWVAGASSVQQLPAGQNGWAEATVIKNNSGNNNGVAFGLSQTDADANYTSISYGWRQGLQMAYAYEKNGAPIAQVATVPGDILRIERVGSVINFKKNGVVIKTSATPSTTSLMYDNSLYGTTAMVLNAKGSFAKDSSIVTRTFTYDHAGRLLQTWHSLNGATPVLLVSNSYNELGQRVTKSLYKSGNAFKQNVDYAYNTRGWLTRINDSDLSSAANQAENGNSALPDLFGMNLLYEQADAGLNNTQQYNGNISAIKWSNNLSLSGTKSFAYNYGYDPMNRILSAEHYTNSGLWASSGKFSEDSLKYDLNGNIKKLRRTDASGAQMDFITYDYTSNGNQLRSVTDGGDINSGFFDGNITGDDYTYDGNGNMTVDKNKNIASIAYNHLNLPNKVTKGTADNIVYIYDAGGRKLTQKVYNTSNILTKTTDYLGEYIYQNDTLQFINHEEGRIVMRPLAPGENGVRPEYQFHLKDHLGNVRTTFTTARNVDTPVATFETANQNLEQSQFLRYDDARLINSTLFDHTRNGVTAYSQRLSGSANEKLGVARSISVMPGDTLNLKVYAKYVDPAYVNTTTPAGQNLMTLIGNASAGAVGTAIDGANYGVNGITPFPYPNPVVHDHDVAAAPKAYLNYLIFDRNFVKQDGGYVQMHGGAYGREDGSNVKHDSLQQQIIIKQPGYVYIYLSNDETTAREVYFDDFKVQQIKSPVVQQEDFYPFGLTFNSYTRENAVPQKYLYNGKELQTDLGLNWEDYGARMYMSDIGRWGIVDPKADKYVAMSPWVYVANNPIIFIDPNGKEIVLGANSTKEFRQTVLKNLQKLTNAEIELVGNIIRIKENGQAQNTQHNLKEGTSLISDLIGSTHKIVIKAGKKWETTSSYTAKNDNESEPTGSIITANLNDLVKVVREDGSETSGEAWEYFAHELGHANLRAKGKGDPNGGDDFVDPDNVKVDKDGKVIDDGKGYLDNEEIQVRKDTNKIINEQHNGKAKKSELRKEPYQEN